MAKSKELLVIFLISLANAKIINGSPLKENEGSGEDKHVPVHFSTEGTDDKHLTSVDHKGKESEATDVKIDNLQTTKSVGKSDEIPINVGKGMQMQNIGPYGLSITSDEDRVTITNTYIHDTFDGMASTTANIIGGAIMIGDKNRMIYSAKPDEVVLVEGKKCYRRTYRNRVRMSNELMSPSDCTDILDIIRRKSSGSWSQTVTTPEGGTVVNNFNNGPPSYQQNTGTSHYGNSDYSFSKPGVVNNFFSGPPSYQQSSGNQWSTGNISGVGNTTPFGNNWPFGPVNNPFVPNSGKLGSNNGNNENSGRRNNRRTSKRRVSGNPNVIISWIGSI